MNTMRLSILLCLACVALAMPGCAGGSPIGNGAGTASAAPDPDPDPVADDGAPAAPQLPAVQGEVIGLPGAVVPGLDAFYVATSLGWLGPDDDVVFEAVIAWRLTGELGCGILRRGADGNVGVVLMQGQALPGTGGVVRHPRLPLEARGTTLVMAADVDGGTVARGLFAVPKWGGAPVLLADAGDGEFAAAVIGEDGTVVAERRDPGGSTILVVEPGSAPRTLREGCAPGFATDGARVLVREDGRALSVGLDGTATALLAPGDPAPGGAGRVEAVRGVWLADGGDAVLHVATDDPARSEVIVRMGASVEVVAACGAPAPGTAGLFRTLQPAAGRSTDVVFGASVVGDAAVGAAVYAAPAGAPPALVAAQWDPAGDVGGAALAIEPGSVVAADAGGVAFGAWVVGDGFAEQGVFRAGPDGARRIVTTGAPVAALPGAVVGRFMVPLRDAVRTAPDGRTLVHVGIVEARRPDATLGALLLVR